MAIAHIATEYVFSDFLLKEPPETRYKGLRLELALDKIVTCIAVGLPLLLISLAFAQEVSIGNSGSLPLPVPGASRGGQRARRGGGSKHSARCGSAAGGVPARGRAEGALGRGKERRLPGKEPSPRASLAAGSSRCAGLPRRPSPRFPVPSSALGHSLAAAVLSAPPSRSLVSPADSSPPVGVMGSAGAVPPFVSQRSSLRLEQPAGMCPGNCPSAAAPGARGVGQGGLGVTGQLSGTGVPEKGCQSSAFALQAARWGCAPTGRAAGELSEAFRCSSARLQLFQFSF